VYFKMQGSFLALYKRLALLQAQFTLLPLPLLLRVILPHLVMVRLAHLVMVRLAHLVMVRLAHLVLIPMESPPAI